MAYFDPASTEFLDKEVFTDVTAGEKHEVDLVVKARFRERDAFFLVHVENQASAQSDFPNVLDFQYTVIQLNRLPWRRFVTRANPVASALMAKRKMAVRDRPKVKLECLRLLATLRLDPAKSRLINGFIESYLKLNAAERKRYERELAKLAPQDREATMELTNSWEERGREQGLHEGKEGLLVRQLRSRFKDLSDTLARRIDGLSAEQMDELGVALLNFTSPADLEQWLSRHMPQ